MKDDRELQNLIGYYRDQGAPGDQQMLASLLREAQEISGGVLTGQVLDTICAAYQMKETVLRAMIRRIPSLKYEDAPHSLEICSTCGKARELIRLVESEFAGRPGCGFTFRTTGCMKNCRKGPSLKWDGELYSQADEALIRRLAGLAKQKS
ncbi:MAG: (2Fe-2S) ferredoxin domain-containing protein [Clostridia bacterium]|nr:(2Fe-2S) ferredoxin domain-containing protein [Clostridia bacterium]